jgi:predicted component of type VI protein secretion system
MALDLHIAGPGLDVVRRLEPGQPELVLGRDSDCDVCLPDPQRNVSRRHLSLWIEEGELHFRVLSVVNGVEMPFGEAPPGARGVLALGQTLKVAEYSVSAAAVPNPADPWAVFEDRDGSRVARADGASLASGQTGGFAVPASAEEDPFGEWGFEATFGPGPLGGGALDAGKLAPGDLTFFFQGMGLDPATVGALSQGEIEAMGQLVRTLVVGALELHASTMGVKKELRAEDRTMVAARDDNNPLKTEWPQETKLRYLFGGRATGVGFVSPERAVRELMVDLIAHNKASGAASRAALEATLREFAPDALKTRLLGEGTRLFEGKRAWDAYVKYYQDLGRDMPRWAQQMLDKYFTDAYLRESLRIRRETTPQKR